MSPYIRMMEEIRISIYKQIVELNIYQIYMVVWCKIKSIVTRQWKIYILEYVLEYLIDKKEGNIDNYNY